MNGNRRDFSSNVFVPAPQTGNVAVITTNSQAHQPKHLNSKAAPRFDPGMSDRGWPVAMELAG